MEGSDDRTWIAPAAWAAVTIVLTVVVFTLDPLWAYYGAWAAGFMTAFSAIRREILKSERRRIDSEHEALLLEVKQARTAEGEEKLGPDPS